MISMLGMMRMSRKKMIVHMKRGIRINLGSSCCRDSAPVYIVSVLVPTEALTNRISTTVANTGG